MATNYWDKRAAANERLANQHAETIALRQKKLYNKTYKEIAAALNELLLSLAPNATLTRSQLWQFKKYIDLDAKITSLLESQSSQQVSMTEEILRQIFEETIGQTLEDFNVPSSVGYTIVNETQAKQVINTAWNGQHFSQRIYGANSKIAARIKKNITDLVVMGKNPDEIKRKLMDDLGVSFSNADRLVRTEANHVFNEAAKAGYKRAGVEYIKVLIENDRKCCHKCQENKGTYPIAEAPRLPTHPNCRCAYAPVVELDVKQQRAVYKTEQLQDKPPLVFYKRSPNHQQHAEDMTGLKGEAAWGAYQKKANEFLRLPVDGKNVDAFVSDGGTYFKYKFDTNEFGMISDKGTISTYFNPKDYSDYWIDQIHKYKEVIK